MDFVKLSSHAQDADGLHGQKLRVSGADADAVEMAVHACSFISIFPVVGVEAMERLFCVHPHRTGRIILPPSRSRDQFLPLLTCESLAKNRSFI